jgi:hypothetical protein
VNAETVARDTPPSSRRLPVAAFPALNDARSRRVVLHVFCPRVVAATPLEGCRDCPSCIAIDPGAREGEPEGEGARPAVVCGW